jgi:hypothetical protein
MADNWERRVLNSWGSNVRFDVNNPQVTEGGRDVYNLYGYTQNEENLSLVTFKETGNFSVYCDKTIEIVGGMKTNENGVDIIISTKNGDLAINAEKNGRVRIRGKDIILQADEDIDLQAGRNVNINSGSGRVLIKGNTLEKTGLKGNLLDPSENWAWRVFEGTGLPAFAFPGLASPFSGIADLAGTLISSPDLFGGFVSSAIDTAIGGAIGGVTGSRSVSGPRGSSPR